VAFTINTNIASLQAQNYLRMTNDFQSKTINRVTSGLRIVASGDDAAGLAIANGYRSDEAVLSQGIRNGNDGLSQLQTADGGINNISLLLDRARTLATQSASGAFTGDRTVLNSEFQSVLGEIDRQAQAVGLNQGGTFAKALNVFFGGGQSSNGVSATTNGSISVDLSASTVDSKSLGLKGVQAGGAAGSDIGVGSSTSVQNIVSNATNLGSITNNTTKFYFTGPGFTDTYGNNVMSIGVNLTGITDTATLATAVNQAIQAAGNGASQQATAFKNANITAAITTDPQGRQQLSFNSASSAFQVQGGDRVSTALLGNFSSGPTGNVASVAATAAANFAAPAANENAVKIRILGAGLNGSAANDISVNIATTDTLATTVANINTAIAANSTLAATGIQAVVSGSAIAFQGRTGQTFEALTAGDIRNTLGFGSWVSAAGINNTATTFDYNTITAAGASTANTQNVEVSVNGGAKISLGTLTGSATLATAIDTLNAAFQGNAQLRDAGLVATNNAGAIKISSAGANFRLNFYGGSGDAFGFGASNGSSVTSTGSTASNYAAKDSVNSAGAQASQNASNTDVYLFNGLRNTGDAQTVTVTAVDSNGAEHTLNVALTTANANNLDQALNTINSAILQSNDATLKQVAAFKERGTSGLANGLEGLRFMSAGGTFKVSLGASQGSPTAGQNVGLADGATGSNGAAVMTSAANGAGSTADISNVSTAQAAVTALSNAIGQLGRAQAVVGRGQNQLTFAINLASSQLSNLAAAESRIRDADLAFESANLTKSQILLQAGIAALAQANSAPQQVLALLRG
jgi:flagellin